MGAPFLGLGVTVGTLSFLLVIPPRGQPFVCTKIPNVRRHCSLNKQSAFFVFGDFELETTMGQKLPPIRSSGFQGLPQLGHSSVIFTSHRKRLVTSVDPVA